MPWGRPHASAATPASSLGSSTVSMMWAVLAQLSVGARGARASSVTMEAGVPVSGTAKVPVTSWPGGEVTATCMWWGLGREWGRLGRVCTWRVSKGRGSMCGFHACPRQRHSGCHAARRLD